MSQATEQWKSFAGEFRHDGSLRDIYVLDLDPREIVDPSKLEAVFEFMSGLANAVGKDVVLTPEKMPETAIFRCRPGVDRIEYTPFGGF